MGAKHIGKLLLVLMICSLANGQSALLAVRDQYETYANTALEVGFSSSDVALRPSGTLLSNDIGGATGGPGLSVTLVGTPVNGSVTVQTDGGFRFIPNPGFIGEASFSYKVSNAERSSEAQVSINVKDVNPAIAGNQVIWYVRSGAANGLGTSDQPFGSLHEAEIASQIGDTIFLFAGQDYTCEETCFTLKSQQQLIGEAAGLGIGTDTLVAKGPLPTLKNASWTGIMLANQTGIQGLRLLNIGAGSTGSAGIRGWDVLIGNISLDTIQIDQPGGFGIVINETDPNKPTTGGQYNLSITNLTINDPGQMGILANDPGNVLIDTTQINNFKISPTENFSGHGIHLESEYNSSLTIRNSTVISTSSGNANQSLVGIFILKNNAFGNAAQKTTVRLELDGNTVTLPATEAAQTLAYQLLIFEGNDQLPPDNGSMTVSGTGNKGTAVESFAFSGPAGKLSGSVNIDEVSYPVSE